MYKILPSLPLFQNSSLSDDFMFDSCLACQMIPGVDPRDRVQAFVYSEQRTAIVHPMVKEKQLRLLKIAGKHIQGRSLPAKVQMWHEQNSGAGTKGKTKSTQINQAFGFLRTCTPALVPLVVSLGKTDKNDS